MEEGAAAIAQAKGDTFLCLDLKEDLMVTVIVWRLGRQTFVEAFNDGGEARGRYNDLLQEGVADAALFIGPQAVMS